MTSTPIDNALKTLLQPASILTGTIIGAGVFSLPFVFLSAGLSTSFFYLLFFGLIFILLYLLYADIIARTPGEHRFAGYARIYLGRWGFAAALAIGVVQLFFVLTIYLILAPSFSRLFIGGDFPLHVLAFWLIGSLALFADSRRFARMESAIVAGIALIMALLFFSGIGKFMISPIGFGNPDLTKFLAVGPILFALSGALAIPEVISYFREEKIPIAYAKRSIMLGGIVPLIAYGAFVLGVIGLSRTVSEDAVSGLIGSVPPEFLTVIGILGILSLTGSYIAVGESLRRTIRYDLGLSDMTGGAAAVLAPIILYGAGFQSFIGAISFVGAIFLPLESILIVAIWIKMNKKSEVSALFVGRWARLVIPVMLLVFLISLFYAIL